MSWIDSFDTWHPTLQILLFILSIAVLMSVLFLVRWLDRRKWKCQACGDRAGMKGKSVLVFGSNALLCSGCYRAFKKVKKTTNLGEFLRGVKGDAPKVKVSDTEVPRRRSIPSHVKREVWRRDLGRCTDCGSQEKLEYDHIIPLSRGGANTVRNLQLLCERCNRSKGAKIQ